MRQSIKDQKKWSQWMRDASAASEAHLSFNSLDTVYESFDRGSYSNFNSIPIYKDEAGCEMPMDFLEKEEMNNAISKSLIHHCAISFKLGFVLTFKI